MVIEDAYQVSFVVSESDLGDAMQMITDVTGWRMRDLRIVPVELDVVDARERLLAMGRVRGVEEEGRGTP